MRRKPYSVRLTDEEVAMARSRGRNLSDAIRRLIHGPDPEPIAPLPLLGEALESGRVYFTDASGTYELAPRDVRLSSQTWPPIPTYNAPVHTAFAVPKEEVAP